MVPDREPAKNMPQWDACRPCNTPTSRIRVHASNQKADCYDVDQVHSNQQALDELGAFAELPEKNQAPDNSYQRERLHHVRGCKSRRNASQKLQRVASGAHNPGCECQVMPVVIGEVLVHCRRLIRHLRTHRTDHHAGKEDGNGEPEVGSPPGQASFALGKPPKLVVHSDVEEGREEAEGQTTRRSHGNPCSNSVRILDSALLS
mmetsp:Transcript_28758/g.72807  ORF Transcript_28758/g.72807 Transcript_28758/m.72807 type:complete len:204 (-) Transcript_28758:735-1346(-)